MTDISILWLVIGSVLCGVSLVSLFMPRWPAAVFAYAAMWTCQGQEGAVFTASALVFWGIATLIALGITYMLPPQVSRARLGLAYISGGALVGMAVGMVTLTMAGIIVGAVIGAILGAIAASRTRAGQTLQFPTMKFFNYVAAKGLPAVVTVSMLGASLLLYLTQC